MRLAKIMAAAVAAFGMTTVGAAAAVAAPAGPAASTVGAAAAPAAAPAAVGDVLLRSCRTKSVTGATIIEAYWYAVKGGATRYLTFRATPGINYAGAAYTLRNVSVTQGQTVYNYGATPSSPRLYVPRTAPGVVSVVGGRWTSAAGQHFVFSCRIDTAA